VSSTGVLILVLHACKQHSGLRDAVSIGTLPSTVQVAQQKHDTDEHNTRLLVHLQRIVSRQYGLAWPKLMKDTYQLV
jgi:hypothetical protein